MSSSKTTTMPGRTNVRKVPMRLIVCGVQRTGTLSMRHALFKLGLHNVHHMYSLFHDDPGSASAWTRALKAKYLPSGKPFTRDDWDAVLGDCQAVIDCPSALFAVELAAAYPEAKVIILNRDPESWYASVVNTIGLQSSPPVGIKLLTVFCCIFDPLMRSSLEFFVTLNRLGFGGLQWNDKQKGIEWFHSMYAEYREKIAEDRRIEMTVKDGWGPLCDFLQVPVPTERDPATGEVRDIPFPRMNDQVQFKEHMDKWMISMIRRSVTNMLAVIGASAVIGAAGWGVWRTGKMDPILSWIKSKV